MIIISKSESHFHLSFALSVIWNTFQEFLYWVFVFEDVSIFVSSQFLIFFATLWHAGIFPWPGIEPISPALDVWSPNHWTARSPRSFLPASLPWTPSSFLSQPLSSFVLISSSSLNSFPYLGSQTIEMLIVT